ncbi:MAG TPA: copper homeostasis protein CutC, partial [Sphingobacteriaceae bacterium]|nr:copper homeostasis protein CutC [Sphingobacteriaceae bacterium]
MPFKLEIIGFNIASCIAIDKSGAHRIELCDNPHEGGTTPSFGFIKMAREKVSIDLFPIIRPRGGDFLYSADEFLIMEKDVKLCREAGCNGVVLGLLNKDGSIDTERTSRLVELAYPMEVTFHRAFDHCNDPMKALEQLIEAGCKRILTSGQQPLAIQGAGLLSELVKAAAGRIIIMPGSGVRKDTIKELAEKTGAVEFHSSLRMTLSSKMDFVNPAFSALKESDYTSVDAGAIKELLNEMNIT